MTLRPPHNSSSASRHNRIKTPPQGGLFPDTGGTLLGSVERIRFRADDTGYSVLVVQPDGEYPPLVVVGYLSSIQEGERIEFEGEWKEHPRFGRQFQATASKQIIPTTAEGIEKFLASGTVKNIGPALAKRIVARFGEESLEVIENEPRRLLEISGLGEKKLTGMVESWQSQSEIKEVMLFLQNHDVPLHMAEKVYRAYGSAAIQVLREDPYRLATDIFGVGFRTADRVAQKIGVPTDSPRRCEAGAFYVLNRLGESDGHVYVPMEELITQAAEILEVSREQVAEAVESLRKSGRVIVEDIGIQATGDAPGAAAGQNAVYAQPYHAAETEVARRLSALIKAPRDEARLEAALRGKGASGDTIKERLSAVSKRAIEGGAATGEQARAIEGALAEKVLVVTGGPGTGKTTIIKAVTRLYSDLGLQVILGAPTGRAAKRLSEVTGHEAATIHRLLEYTWASGGFLRDASQPLVADAVIIDEASMMDIHLMAHLLRAIPDAATFVLVGDVDQLPSVGPGMVLNDVIESEALPIVKLMEVFRQAKESLIVENAHRVNRGEMPFEPKGTEDLRDYYFIEENDAERCADILVELCRERIRQRFNLDPIADVQIITPMQRGTLGVQKLNTRLQEVLNPLGAGGSIQSGGRSFRPGDKLIQTRNNYEKNVFNGDIGIIVSVDPSQGSIRVNFDPNIIEYTQSALDEVVHAYAVTIHKSQGSEYPAVIIPLHTQHYPMLQRNLVYTALTRAKKLAIFIGSKRALAMAVKNAKVRRRWSHLASRIRQNAGLSPRLPKAVEEMESAKSMDSAEAKIVGAVAVDAVDTATAVKTADTVDAGETMPPPTVNSEKVALLKEKKDASNASWDERPPDSVYEAGAVEENFDENVDFGGDDSPLPGGKLTYHPIIDE